jgi:RNA polymerase sigma factor (sigma-70 family)
MMRNERMKMKMYKNWGIDMDGLSMTDPVRYRKINAVLAEKGKKKDLLDMVETVPLESAYYLVDKGPSPEDVAYLSELKTAATAALATLTPREERVLRKRFGIGLPTDYTLKEVAKELSVISERIRQIEAKSLRKLKRPSVTRKLRAFLDAA